MQVVRSHLTSAMPDLAALRAVALEFKFTEGTHVGPLHGLGLVGFIKSLLSADLPAGCWIRVTDANVPWFESGSMYRFAIYATTHSLDEVDRILRRVRSISSKKKRLGDSRAFGPRWDFVQAVDAFRDDDKKIGCVADLSVLDSEMLESEAELWASMERPWLRFISPVQLLRPKSARGKKGMGRFCQDAEEINGAFFLDRIRQSFDALGRRLGVSVSLPRPDARINFIASDLFWHGAQQVGTDGSEKPVYGLGGVIRLEVEGPNSEMVWQWLVLGQHLGIGQRRGFGLGHYRLEGPEGERIGTLPERRASLLRPSFSLANLDAAWDAIRSNKRKPGFERELDKVTFGLPPDADQRTELARLAKCIADDEYDFPSLEGIIIDKPTGGQRALAVPPLLDRVLQRAVAQMLTRIIEPVMYAHSYGYRPGRNRMQARDLIQRLVREGYTWFFESDIDSFFDAVDHALIYNRLMSLLPDDPVVDRIMRWITAPVRYQGRLIQRGGLPQGSPLSPLLANLVLDDFDKDLVAAGFKPVRFADDFVVPCKSKEQAERAAEVVVRSLKEKGLTLNEDQSRVARFSDGLKFLGYRFLNDLAIETKRSRKPVSAAEEDPHPGSWLAGVETVEGKTPALDDMAGNATTAESESDQPGASTGEAAAVGTLVIVSEPGCVLYTREGQLWRQRPEQPADSIAPWPELGGLLLLGYQRVTQAVLARCMDHQVPVHFTDGFGHLKGILLSAATHEPGEHWPAQVAACESRSDCLRIARELATARILNQAQVLRRRGMRSDDLRVFSKGAKNAAEAESLEALRGIEGTAGRAYFAEVARLVPDWVGFQGRNRRPPRDPFNALLSLGYTMLYAQTETLIRIVGLNARFGFYHQRRGRHAALASDLMEPFRHLVEGTAMAQLNRRQLGEDAFRLDAEKGCRLSNAGRRTFLVALARRLSGRMTTSEGISATGHEHMFRQAQTLLAWIWDREQAFAATRLK